MASTPSVSVVIPCYNPTDFLLETLASVEAQHLRPVEIILVNDGTDSTAGLQAIRKAGERATRVIEQPNRGLAAARNAGFRAATGSYVVPLDSDDKLEPDFISECVGTLAANPEAAFVYTDYRVFGDTRYIERLPDYNLYPLLFENTLIYAALIRRADWEAAGGYDETMRLGYEDWDFWLRLAERERFGRHLPRPLFQYRKHGRTLLSLSREHHGELVEKIHSNHPHLYSWEGRARIKACWQPAVCVVGSALAAEQVAAQQEITDVEWLALEDFPALLQRSKAEAFLVPPSPGRCEENAAEMCALAVWGGHDAIRLPCGALAVSRKGLTRAASVDGLSGLLRVTGSPSPQRPPSRYLGTFHRHLINAELTSLRPWLRHPLRSALRLIPLRLKEDVNRRAGRPIFDLSFYLKFQPQSVLTEQGLVPPLRYMPRRAPVGREVTRIMLLTPHLGPGGAESVLMEAASAVSGPESELFLVATQSSDSRWRSRWQQLAAHIYDLASLVSPERIVPAVYSIFLNWEFDVLVLQNSLAAYSAIPLIRKDAPAVKIVDWIHAVDPAWDMVSASSPVASLIDTRVVISEAARQRLMQAGTPPDRIRLIRNGIDLERFHPAACENRPVKRVLFAGRLDPVKRPLLLPEIAARLVRIRPSRDFCFVVAGDGDEARALGKRVNQAGLASQFELLGHTEEMPALLSQADIVIFTSEKEGIPLIALEAMASGKPVIGSRVGAADEVIDASTGILIDRGAGDAERFAAAIHDLLDDPDRRSALGAAGRRKVEAEHDREHSRQAYRELLLKLTLGNS